MLAASKDLIDMIHAHPAWEEGGPKIQFNVIFPSRECIACGYSSNGEEW
jgi:hypothetical protein